MIVFVGGVIKKDGKYLLVQEGQQECYGQWGVPGGLLDFDEKIIDGAIREIKEETGCLASIKGLCLLGNRVLKDDLTLFVVFEGELIEEDIKPDNEEILDVKWFSYEEICNMKERLRSSDLVLKCIENSKTGNVVSLDVIDVLK